MGPRPHLLFWAHITACLAQEYKGYIGSSPHCGFCMQNSDTLDQNYKFLLVPENTCHFVHVQERA